MKKRYTYLLLIAALLIMVIGCASAPLAPPETDALVKNMAPPPGKALLYVYRDNQFLGSGVIYDVYIDGQRIKGKLAVDTYIAVVLEPGEHQLSYVADHIKPSAVAAALEESYITINVGAGEKHYLMVSNLDFLSDKKTVTKVPDAFSGKKLVLKSEKPFTLAAAGVKEPQVASPNTERGQAVASDIDILPAIGAKPDKNRYAIVIGIEKYREKLPKAEFAAADARLVGKYCTKILGVPEENLVVMTDGKATKSDMEKYFQRWLLNNVTKESDVYIYFSGHGAPDPSRGDAYLVPYDGDPTYIVETGYPLNRLYDILGRLPSKRNTVVLDSCFSGTGNRSVIAAGLRPLVVMAGDREMIKHNTAVLSASAGNQASSTYMEKGHGLLTYFILKGLKEENVVSREGRLDIDRLYPYVKENVERIARKRYNNDQVPQLVGAR